MILCGYALQRCFTWALRHFRLVGGSRPKSATVINPDLSNFVIFDFFTQFNYRALHRFEATHSCAMEVTGIR